MLLTFGLLRLDGGKLLNDDMYADCVCYRLTQLVRRMQIKDCNRGG